MIRLSPEHHDWTGWVALIPARGGSKGIPDKNLREVGGLSLVARAVRKAKAARSVARVLVSTDSEAIAQAALEEGAEAPFLRPCELARDDTPTSEVLAHAWHYLRERESFRRPVEGLALLQPTSPFLKSESIDHALDIFCRSGARILKAIRAVKDHPAWMVQKTEGGFLSPYLPGSPRRRQDLERLFIPCGALYLYRREVLNHPEDHPKTAWLELPWPESLDVDDPGDLVVAELLAASGRGGDGLVSLPAKP
ncbi:MAG: acylneuraminate cytidylyltransferase family protein [Planctomycetes bacterium]|nr:acylneuraminate cytidylyltransferase family protein [Planctomycetota bacterium]